MTKSLHDGDDDVSICLKTKLRKSTFDCVTQKQGDVITFDVTWTS